jgi:hypothetical protein
VRNIPVAIFTSCFQSITKLLMLSKLRKESREDGPPAKKNPPPGSVGSGSCTHEYYGPLRLESGSHGQVNDG